MAAQVGVTRYYILVKSDSPDGSTYLGHKYCNILVNFAHPDAAQVGVTCITVF